MDLRDVTYRGPAIDDEPLQALLPQNLRTLLQTVNGFVQFQGGLHLRGACLAPDWHSLRHAWKSEEAFHRMYPAVEPNDIPFAQDCLGDQFLLRGGGVLQLMAETGEIEAIAPDLETFLKAARAEPVDYLSLQPLLQLLDEGSHLEPGQLIHVYPPFCTAESADGVSLRAVPAQEVIGFHAILAAQLPPDGSEIAIEVTD